MIVCASEEACGCSAPLPPSEGLLTDAWGRCAHPHAAEAQVGPGGVWKRRVWGMPHPDVPEVEAARVAGILVQASREGAARLGCGEGLAPCRRRALSPDL